MNNVKRFKSGRYEDFCIFLVTGDAFLSKIRRYARIEKN